MTIVEVVFIGLLTFLIGHTKGFREAEAKQKICLKNETKYVWMGSTQTLNNSGIIYVPQREGKE